MMDLKTYWREEDGEGHNRHFLRRVDEDLLFDLKDVWGLEMEERDKSRLIFLSWLA